MSDLNFNLLQQNVKRLIDDHNITQQELASYIGMSQANVSKALNPNEKKQFTLEQVFRIARHFGVSIDSLTGNEESSDSSTSPRAMLKLITKLLRNNTIQITELPQVMESVYLPFINNYGLADCKIDLRQCSYVGFYFPDYLDFPPGLDEDERDDKHYDYCCDGNESPYKKLNEVLKKFIPMIKLYQETEIPEEAFTMVLNGYLEQLSDK